jgi:DNA-binding MarR family transcriptional regulator
MIELSDSQTTSPDQLVGLTSALIRAEHRHAAFLARRMNLPAADTLALYHLANEPLKARELAERLGLSPGSVTALTDRLAARNLARRISHDSDRRVVLIELTPEGHSETWQILQYFIKNVIQISTERSPAERLAVGRFLEDLIRAIDNDTLRLQSAAASSSKTTP